MAISFVKKAAAGTATAEKEKAVTTAKKKPGQTKKLPIDGLNFNQQQRLRVGHLLTFSKSVPRNCTKCVPLEKSQNQRVTLALAQGQHHIG